MPSYSNRRTPDVCTKMRSSFQLPFQNTVAQLSLFFFFIKIVVCTCKMAEEVYVHS